MKLFHSLLTFCQLLCTLSRLVEALSLTEPFQTKHGQVIRGRRITIFGGVQVDEFLGIPYARPPERFQYAQPLEPPAPGQEYFNATSLPNSCIQDSFRYFKGTIYERGENAWNPNTPISEDCLYLNIWAPSQLTANGKKAAVMLWIYGGGFVTGTSTLDVYNGSALAAKQNVVVVTINYRISSLGFATLNNKEMPPNIGIMDQNLAIVWVHENIQFFGGNPELVTLFGESAGAASVSMHLLSKESRPYFKRAILQSASGTNPWASITPREAVYRTFRLAKVMNCLDERVPYTQFVEQQVPPRSHSDYNKQPTMAARHLQLRALSCLKSLQAKDFRSDYIGSFGVLGFQFMPVQDGTFLPDSPQKLLNQTDFKKTELLMGFNANEGSYWLMYNYISNWSRTVNPSVPIHAQTGQIDEDYFNSNVQSLFIAYPRWPQKTGERPAIIGAITNQYKPVGYYPPDQLGRAYTYALDQAIGDYGFTCDVIKWAKTYAENNQRVYMYYLSQRSKNSPWPEWFGTMHGDDVNYVFGEPFRYPNSKFSTGDRHVSQNIMQYWANFARTGDPNLSPLNPHDPDNTSTMPLNLWPLFTPDYRKVFEINEQLNERDKSQNVLTAPKARECYFWNTFMPELHANQQIAINRLDKCNKATETCIRQRQQQACTSSTTSLQYPLTSLSILLTMLFVA